MPFVKKPQVFSAKINELTLGTGDQAVTLGGQNVYNLYAFDGEIANRPKIGIDVSDDPEQPSEGLKAFYAGCDTLAQRAAKAAELEDVDFVCIRFDMADPNGANKSIEDCVADAKAVAEAVSKPIVVAGCKNAEKDADLFSKVSEALQARTSWSSPPRRRTTRASPPAPAWPTARRWARSPPWTSTWPSSSTSSSPRWAWTATTWP